MRARTTSMRAWGVVVSITSISMMAACGSDDGESDEAPTGADTSVAVDVSSEGVEPDKVILASVLLTVGDIDLALAEGLVTAEEVDRAAAALEAETLQTWIEQAAAAG